MRIASMTWMDVEGYLARDDRAVLPIGSVEQHAYLSLATDAILAERVAVDAAEPLGVPVFPVLAYGVTPYFRAYPGTITLAAETFLQVVRELLDGIAASGFRRIVVVNGHGGNSAAESACSSWVGEHADCRVKFHNWWKAPRTWARVVEIDPEASHASWMENFPWTRAPGGRPPSGAKPMVDWSRIVSMKPTEIREALGDGSFGGRYQRPDNDMAVLWAAAVEETRGLIDGPWS